MNKNLKTLTRNVGKAAAITLAAFVWWFVILVAYASVRALLDPSPINPTGGALTVSFIWFVTAGLVWIERVGRRQDKTTLQEQQRA